MAGCVGAGALRNVFCLLRLHGLHKGIIVYMRTKFRGIEGKKSTQCLHFCERLLLETKDTKSSTRILILSTNERSRSSSSIVVGKTTIGGTETVHRTATKIHRHHAKVEAIALAVSTKIRRETASVTDRERVIRFDE